MILIALVLPVFVLWKNAFPVFNYYLNEANNHGIMIKNKELGDNTFLLNPYYKNYPFSEVDLNVKINKNIVSGLKQPVKISICENYEAMAYPKKGEINSIEDFEKYLYFNDQSDIPNGTIFSNGESAFFVSRGEYRPILSGEIFEKLGFNWNVVIPKGTEAFSLLAGEGEKIVFSSAHPDGVILKTETGFYLVWEESLVKIKNEEIIKDVWERYYIVPAKELFELDFCVVDVIRDNEINCNFDVSGSISPNQPYIFKFNQRELGASIIDAHTQLKVSVKLKDMKKSFFILMSNVKKDLASKYGEYLF